MIDGDTQEQQPDEFDSLFFKDEQAGDKDGDGTQVTDDSKEGSTPPATQEGEQSDEQGDSGAAGGDGDGGSASPPAATDTGNGEDWLASLPDDVRARIESDRKAAEDRYNALHGRLAPVQRQLGELQQRLAQAEQQRAPAAQASDAQDAKDSFFDSEAFKQYEEDFPSDAKVMRQAIETTRKHADTRISQLEQQLQQIAGKVDLTVTAEQQRTQEAEIQRLAKAHPDWEQYDKDQGFWEHFEAWRDKQPRIIRDQFQTEDQLTTAFADADFVIERLNEYKAAKAPAPKADAPAANQNAEPAQKRSNARVDMGVAPDVRGHGQSAAGEPLEALSEAEQFEHLYRQADPSYKPNR